MTGATGWGTSGWQGMMLLEMALAAVWRLEGWGQNGCGRPPERQQSSQEMREWTNYLDGWVGGTWWVSKGKDVGLDG